MDSRFRGNDGATGGNDGFPGNGVLIPQADGYQAVAPLFVADFDGLAQGLVQAQVGAVFFQRGIGGEGPDLAAAVADA